MKWKVFLLLLIFALWSSLSAWYYINVIKAVQTLDVSTIQTINHTMNLRFEESSDFPILSDSFVEKKRALLADFNDLDTLVITGFFSSEEDNITTSIDLGEARANAARALFSEIPEERVILKSETKNQNEIANLFHCIITVKKPKSISAIGPKRGYQIQNEPGLIKHHTEYTIQSFPKLHDNV